MNRAVRSLIMVYLLACIPANGESDFPPLIPEGFVFLDQFIPDLVVELRYASSDNFVGKPVDSYGHGRAILSSEAAQALARVQAYLKEFRLGLKVYDAYRPQRAVDHFMRWGEDLEDQSTKPQYYPDVNKEELFERGYIAAKSSHSRGSTVDVTIVILDSSGEIEELDMGSPFDYFDPASWPTAVDKVSPQQRANRALLQRVMAAEGFGSYPYEWWHFTLENERYPDTYFDFPDAESVR